MSVSLDPTVGGAAANSYASVDEADAYFATRLYSSAWTGLTGGSAADTKAQALITATRKIDTLPWDGETAFLAQRLQWPRVGLYDRAGNAVLGTAIPDDIKTMVFETAIDLLTVGKDAGAVDPLANFSAIKIGSLALSLRENAPRTADRLRESVLALAAPYLVDATDFSRG